MCKQCQKWWSGGALAVGLVGGGNWGRDISYLGRAGLVIPIWDVLTPQGEQEQALNHSTTRPRSLTFPIRQAVPVGLARARFCSWARWASFFIF